MLDSVYLVKFLASFIVLLVFLYAIYYYIKNYHPQLKSEGKNIKIIESKIVGKNRVFYLVEVNGTQMLLVADEQGMHLIKEWKQSDT